MRIVLKPHVKQIKRGFAATCVELPVTAHGFSPEVAQANLCSVVRMLYRSLERGGELQRGIEETGVLVEEDGSDGIQVTCG